MLQIQALQSLGSEQTNSTESLLNNDSSIFSEMIQELLNDSTSNQTTTNLSSLLGSIYSTTNSSSGISNMLSTNKFSTNGDNSTYGPASLFTNKKSTTDSADLLNDYVSKVTKGSTYKNLFEGANQYASIIKKASATYDVPEKLIVSVMKQESNFNPSVQSTAGATGLMQLMPGTAKYLGVKNSLDPEQNIMGGTKYLRMMLDKFDNDTSLALAAYNAGPGNVQKYNGIPPFKETSNYVKNVLQNAQA